MTDHLPFVTKTAAGITFVTGTNLILSSGTLAVVNSPDFPGNLVVGQSASINQDVLFSGSINLVAGSGIAFDGRTISNTAASASIAGVAQINGQTGTVLLNAGPGMSINTSGGTINVVNVGTITPGVNVILNSGTLAVPLSAGPGLDFSSGTFTNIATLVPGVNVIISGGSIGVPLYAGNGISFANATITNAGVLSVQGFTGNVSLVGGTGIDIVSNTVINTGVTAINGQTGSLVAVSTLTSGAGISVSYVSGTTIVANTGVLSFNNATGNVTGVNSVNGVTDNVILNQGPGISIGSPNGGSILISNSAPLYAVGTGLSLYNGTIINTGQTSPLSAGPGISIADSTITNTAPLYAVGAGLSLSNGTVINTAQSSSLAAGDNINISGGSIGVVTDPSFSGSVTASILTGQVLDIIGDAGAGTLAFGWTDFGTIPSQNVMGLEWTVGSGNIGYYMQIYDGAVNSQGTVLIRQWGPLNYTVYPQFTPNGGIDIPTQYLSGLTTGGGTLAVTSSGFATIGLQLLGSSSTLTATVVVPSLSLWNVSVYSAVPSAVSQNGTIAFATINVVNTATVSTPAPFQQPVSVPSSILQYANATLTNVQFSDTSGATILPSWRESGTVNSGTALYWVLFSQGLPASSTTSILWMSFLNGQNTLNSGTTGLSPQLPEYYGAAYATDDTGSIVFPDFYNNFAGTVLQGMTPLVGVGASYVVNNSLSLISPGSSGSQSVHVTSTVAIQPQIVEAMFTDVHTGTLGVFTVSYSTVLPTFSQTNDFGFITDWRFDHYSGEYRMVSDVNGQGDVVLTTSAGPMKNNTVMGLLWMDSTILNGITNESSTQLVLFSSTVPFVSSYPGTFNGTGYNTSSTVTIQWMRQRSTPPLYGFNTISSPYAPVAATVQVTVQYNDPNAGQITANIINTTLSGGEVTSYMAPFVASGTIMVNYIGSSAYFSYRVS